MNREQLIAKLQKRYPNKMFRTTEEFNGVEGGIWTSGEDGYTHNGVPLFNYYAQDSGGNSYVFGVRKILHDFLEEQGWFCEWNDPGTVMIWKL